MFRLIISLLLVVILIMVVISPFMPMIRSFFSKKVDDLDKQYGGNEDEDGRL